MGAQYYLWAWGVYWLAAMGCLLVWYRMTRSIRARSLKILLRAGAWIVLCTPWPQGNESGPLSPAFLTMLFDGLTLGPESMLRTLPVLLGLLALLLFLLLVDAVWGAGKREQRPPQSS
ncbi:hypothetical protein [Aestuariirhabdus litorea]|uniref:Uncharacterized protein n=1 Tax=Aestuariirhabdus litorea TaxID=2528527 RepID=A0A3P3VPC1_9GAMM|nr:hypothetical protein [Aestuariirhabdus litorea]RRJ84555.1 hypothetical protein D0544_05480 [Aestuariirhabdus litorea]RWW97781.1 hypothetical protein DZC74_05480 [Endozoicomonadaceae bacterium GTF-13]